MPVNVIVKLHDRSRDLRERYSGGVDWVGPAAAAARRRARASLAPGHDISPYLVAADVMVTDHSSAGFEFLLRDRPIVRIHRPELIELANIHPDYVGAAGLGVAYRSTTCRRTRRRGRARRWRDPGEQRAERAPQSPPICSTGRAAPPRGRCAQLYEAIELEPAAAIAAAPAPARSRSHASSQRNHAGVQRRALHRRGD